MDLCALFVQIIVEQKKKVPIFVAALFPNIEDFFWQILQKVL